jgi:hypothetical protein
MHRRLGVIAAILFSFSTFADQLPYPKNPDLNLTPGKYCTHPDSYRYKEHIPYCRRDVSSGLKRAVIAEYNEKDGYNITPEERGDFKIDHLIPLCMGGANEEDNLWPQHKTVYVITDPIEELGCEKMAEGKLLQKDAVALLMRAKMHLEQADEVISELNAL